MALFGLFDYCKDCGAMKSKKNLDENRRCDVCAMRARIKSFFQQKATPRQPTVSPSPIEAPRRPPQQKAAPHQPAVTPKSIEAPRRDPLDTAVRYSFSASNVYANCAMVYRYPNVAVSNVNRDILREIVVQRDYRVELSVSESGEVFALKDGQTIAKIEDCVQMCIDWLQKQQPVICEFAYFAAGKEKVALFFYRDEAARMEGESFEVVKLTGCLSAEKQETIAFLEKGEKLFIELDDNEKPYVRDIAYNPIGRLPAKIDRLHENDSILGIYFDHSETKESEDFEKDDKEIPYVKVYFSK